MSKASEKELASLHALLAKSLADAITNGVPVVDKEGNTITVPAGAAVLNVARQFLKDNNIQATEENQGVKDLVAALPDFAADTETLN